MPNLTLNFRPKSLGTGTVVNIYIPEALSEDTPVLYLLHGMNGDQNSWINGSSICKYAREGQFAVIMPYAANSFYSNMRYGGRYFDYIAHELPEYIGKLIPAISRKREKTFIAGLSMGGYGAVKVALRVPERFSAAASLSAPLDIIEDVRIPGWSDVATCNWGEDYENSVKKSEDDLLHLLDTFPKDKPKPRLYLACGTEDFLYTQNQTFLAHINGKGFDYVYTEKPGSHNWDFFGSMILPAIEYMFASTEEQK